MPSLPSFVRLLPQKGEKLFQSESSLGYSEGFLFYKTFKYYMTEKKRNIYHILKRPFQNIKPFPTSFKFQNYAEVFLPSDIQIGMVVRFLRNIQTMLFIISCQSIQRISLKVIPVFAARVFKVFPSKLFWYLQVLRNYLLSKNISVSKSIIWLSHQVVIYFPDFTFFLNFLHKSAFPFHFTFHKFQYFCATSLAQFGTKYTSICWW